MSSFKPTQSPSFLSPPPPQTVCCSSAMMFAFHELSDFEYCRLKTGRLKRSPFVGLLSDHTPSATTFFSSPSFILNALEG